MEHYDNKKICVEAINFLDTYREGSLPKSVDVEENEVSAEEQKTIEGKGKQRVGNKRYRETEENEESKNDYLLRAIKKKKEERDDIEFKDRDSSQLSAPPPNQLQLLKRHVRRLIKPLIMVPLNSQNLRALQSRKQLNESEDDNIEYDNENELDLTPPPPNQLVNLQTRTPLLLQAVVHPKQMTRKGS